jgi:hypothetical protein
MVGIDDDEQASCPAKAPYVTVEIMSVLSPTAAAALNFHQAK